MAVLQGLFFCALYPPSPSRGEALFFLSVPKLCPSISGFYQKKKGKDFQDIATQRLPLSARNTPRRSIVDIWTRRHWRAERARQEEKNPRSLSRGMAFCLLQANKPHCFRIFLPTSTKKIVNGSLCSKTQPPATQKAH